MLKEFFHWINFYYYLHHHHHCRFLLASASSSFFFPLMLLLPLRAVKKVNWKQTLSKKNHFIPWIVNLFNFFEIFFFMSSCNPYLNTLKMVLRKRMTLWMRPSSFQSQSFSFFLYFTHQNSIKKITANSFLSSSLSTFSLLALLLLFFFLLFLVSKKREEREKLFNMKRKILAKTFFRILYLDDIHLILWLLVKENIKKNFSTFLVVYTLHGMAFMLFSSSLIFFVVAVWI